MGKKKAGLAELTVERRRGLIEPEQMQISVVRQCELLELARSSYYYEPCPESAENLTLMRLIDEQYRAYNSCSRWQRRFMAIAVWRLIYAWRVMLWAKNVFGV